MQKVKSKIFILLYLAIGIIGGANAAEHRKYNIGTIVDNNVYKNWAINVQPSSTSLPAGQGSVESGQEIYAEQCSSCHGEKGEGIKWEETNGSFPRLTGKSQNIKDGKNIGSYWPYTSTIYDYINRAMPITEPGSLSSDQVYSLVAFLLYSNGIIEKDIIVSGENLNKIKMPNHDGFVCEKRPITTGILCMKNCLTPSDKGFNLKSDKALVDKITPIPASDCLLN